jgi:hypothetical protein
MNLEKDSHLHDIDAEDLISEIAKEITGDKQKKKHKNKNLLHAINNKEKYYPYDIPHPPVTEVKHHQDERESHHVIGENTFVYYPEDHKPVINVNGANYDLAPIPHPQYDPNNNHDISYRLPSRSLDSQPREGKPQNRMMSGINNTHAHFFKMVVNNGVSTFTEGMMNSKNHMQPLNNPMQPMTTPMTDPMQLTTSSGSTTDSPFRPIFVSNIKRDNNLTMKKLQEMTEEAVKGRIMNEQMKPIMNTQNMLTQVMEIKEIDQKANQQREMNNQSGNNNLMATNEMKQQMVMKMKLPSINSIPFPPKSSSSSQDPTSKTIMNLLSHHQLRRL